MLKNKLLDFILALGQLPSRLTALLRKRFYYFDPFLNYVEDLKDLKKKKIEYVFQKTEKSNGPS